MYKYVCKNIQTSFVFWGKSAVHQRENPALSIPTIGYKYHRQPPWITTPLFLTPA